MLLHLTQQLPGLSARCWDDDGEFLLIEVRYAAGHTLLDDGGVGRVDVPGGRGEGREEGERRFPSLPFPSTPLDKGGEGAVPGFCHNSRLCMQSCCSGHVCSAPPHTSTRRPAIMVEPCIPYHKQQPGGRQVPHSVPTTTRHKRANITSILKNASTASAALHYMHHRPLMPSPVGSSPRQPATGCGSGQVSCTSSHHHQPRHPHCHQHPLCQRLLQSCAVALWRRDAPSESLQHWAIGVTLLGEMSDRRHVTARHSITADTHGMGLP